jgi:polar amino acid transport system substrate-binding protein
MKMPYNLKLGLLLVAMGLLVACQPNQEDESVSESRPVAENTQQQTEARPDAIDHPATEKTKAETCALVLGWDPWEPYQYQSRDGEVTGLDVDLFREAARRTGCTVSFVQGDWARLLMKLKKGEVDVLLGASITPSRKSFAYFSEPYRSESWVLYVRTGDVEHYQGRSLKALLDSGVRIGLVNEYVYGETIASFRDNPRYEPQFVGFGLSEESFSALLDHKVDGVLEDPFVGADIIRRKGWRKDIVRLPLVLHSGTVHLMFSRKKVGEDVVERFNDALAAMRADGSYRRVLKTYSE